MEDWMGNVWWILLTHSLLLHQGLQSDSQLVWLLTHSSVQGWRREHRLTLMQGFWASMHFLIYLSNRILKTQSSEGQGLLASSGRNAKKDTKRWKSGFAPWQSRHLNQDAPEYYTLLPPRPAPRPALWQLTTSQHVLLGEEGTRWWGPQRREGRWFKTVHDLHPRQKGSRLTKLQNAWFCSCGGRFFHHILMPKTH